MRRILVITFMVLITSVLYAQSQTDTCTYNVETKDGNEYVGQIVREDSTGIWFKTAEMGEFFLLKDYIRKRTKVVAAQLKEGRLWFDNPQSSRYFWSPNSYGLKKGEGYYQNIWVLYNQVSIGVTDYFSVGAGLVPLFLFGGDAPTPVWVIPKFSIPVVKDKFNLGLGVIAGTILGESNSAFGIAYGVGTLGNRDRNLNIGFGWGFTGDGWADQPIVTVSFMGRVSARSYFITENYYVFETLILSFGGRSFVKKVGIDYALVIPLSPDLDGFVAFPVLGITLPFGNFH